MTDIPLHSQTSRGANHALTVALKTMKDRCQTLTNRLASVEEQNVKLQRKQMSMGDLGTEEGRSTTEKLREQVATLSLQKSHMHQKLQMVMEENKQMWSRLGQLCKANQSMGVQLTRISQTLKQHSPRASPANQIEGGDSSVDSLEEISLKLANSILQEKLELEQQCAQMAELHSSSPIDLTTFATEEDENLALNNHYKQLTEVRNLLRSHQEALKSGIRALEALQERRIAAAAAVTAITTVHLGGEDVEEQEQLSALEEWGNTPSPDPSTPDVHPPHPNWTCPMCGEHFPCKRVNFTDFQEHVSNHFPLEDALDPVESTFDFVN